MLFTIIGFVVLFGLLFSATLCVWFIMFNPFGGKLWDEGLAGKLWCALIIYGAYTTWHWYYLELTSIFTLTIN